MLSAAEIARLQADLNGELAGTASIIHYTRGTTPSGGGSPVASGTTTAVCNMWPIPIPAEREGVIGGQMTRADSWVFVFPFGTDVDAADRIVYESTEFEVTAEKTPMTNEIGRMVSARRVGG